MRRARSRSSANERILTVERRPHGGDRRDRERRARPRADDQRSRRCRRRARCRSATCARSRTCRCWRSDGPRRCWSSALASATRRRRRRCIPTVTAWISPTCRATSSACRLLQDGNKGVLHGAAVAVHINDGRQHLQMQPPASYDLITLEPPPIGYAGVSALYSREFYALGARVKPGGYVSQWLPAYQVPPETTLAMVRAFVDVFPQAVLLSGGRVRRAAAGDDRRRGSRSIPGRSPRRWRRATGGARRSHRVTWRACTRSRHVRRLGRRCSPTRRAASSR